MVSVDSKSGAVPPPVYPSLPSQTLSPLQPRPWRARLELTSQELAFPPPIIGASQVALAVENPPANAGDVRDAGSVPGSGGSPRGRHSNPLQDSCLENPMDRGAWLDTVHGVAESWTRLRCEHAHTSYYKAEALILAGILRTATRRLVHPPLSLSPSSILLKCTHISPPPPPGERQRKSHSFLGGFSTGKTQGGLAATGLGEGLERKEENVAQPMMSYFLSLLPPS